MKKITNTFSHAICTAIISGCDDLWPDFIRSLDLGKAEPILLMQYHHCLFVTFTHKSLCRQKPSLISPPCVQSHLYWRLPVYNAACLKTLFHHSYGCCDTSDFIPQVLHFFVECSSVASMIWSDCANWCALTLRMCQPGSKASQLAWSKNSIGWWHYGIPLQADQS